MYDLQKINLKLRWPVPPIRKMSEEQHKNPNFHQGMTVGRRMLLSLVKERLSALDYVKNLYEDNMFLFNSVRIPQSTLVNSNLFKLR